MKKKHTHVFPVLMKVANVRIRAKNDEDAEKKAKNWIKKRASMWYIDNKPVVEILTGKGEKIK